jgi:hypothetical protein
MYQTEASASSAAHAPALYKPPPFRRLRKALSGALSARAEHKSWCACEVCQSLDGLIVTASLRLWYASIERTVRS